LAAILTNVLLVTSGDRAHAQFTYLNQIAGGATNSPGYLQYPYFVSSVGPAGEIVLTEGPFGNAASAYAADGSFLHTVGAGNVAHPIYSAIGPDGTSYLSENSNESIAVVDPNGNFVRSLPSAGGIITPTGVVVSQTGLVYAASKTQINVYSSTFNGTSYPLIGSFGSPGSGPGQIGPSNVGALALDATGANVYVTDPSNNRLEVFSSAGAFVSSIGDASGPGQLNQPTGVAVGGTGLVYATDNNAGIKVFSTSGTYLETVAATVNGRTFNPVSVSVAPTGMIYAGGSFMGGSLDIEAFRFFDPASWSSGTNTFTNANTGPTSVTVGSGQLLGTNLTLDATKGLVVGQSTTVNNGGSLTLAGGTLNTSALVVDGTASSANFTMTGGNLTASKITISNGGIADFVGQPLSVSLAGTVSVADVSSQLKVEQGATFSTTGLTNNGSVTVGPNSDLIVFNSSVNLGTEILNGGELDIRGLLGNGPGSLIEGSGTLTTTAGLANGGRVQFTGQSSVFSLVSNLATGGNIEVSGSQSHTFYGAVTNSGTFTIDSGSSATFQGGYSGPNGTVGTGAAVFAGGLSPNVAVDMSFGGNVTLQHSNTTTMQLAGTTPVTGYDKIDVAGQLSFDGALQIVLDGITPQVGNKFHLFTWGSETGRFSQLNLPALGAGLSWNASQLYSTGTLSVTISGDVNGDGIVNGLDINLIASKWLASGTGVAGDANNDGVVNGLDINLVATNWLHAAGSGTATQVPEPSTAALALLASATLYARRRRS
jgi:hypothetical protein